MYFNHSLQNQSNVIFYGFPVCEQDLFLEIENKEKETGCSQCCNYLNKKFCADCGVEIVKLSASTTELTENFRSFLKEINISFLNKSASEIKNDVKNNRMILIHKFYNQQHFLIGCVFLPDCTTYGLKCYNLEDFDSYRKKIDVIANIFKTRTALLNIPC
jgi:hypothetical protein